jgi:sugar/nucleoside kinase (ribokinase family)
LLLCGGGAADYLAFAQMSALSAAEIKLGSHGAAMRVNGTTYKVSSPVVDVVDTTGAGDAFDAGFIDALLDDATPEDCLRRACICGGLSTRVEGSLRALPRREEVIDIYEQTYAP